MQISVEADKRSIQYIKAILNNWSQKGINTLVEAQKESQRKPKKADTQEFAKATNEWDEMYDN
jgi:DNA replication protein DnaD